jgi:pimeloyl-ACP methyl ester carboxylesterase
MSDRGAGLSAMPPAEAVRSGGVTLRVRRLNAAARPGRERPPRIVALHGGPGLDHHLLLPLGLALAQDFEVWLPDLPGHGGSAPAHSAPPGLRTVEERLGRWLHGLEGGADVLLGHSLGAWLVRELLRPDGAAARVGRPAGVRAAVLLSPPAAGQRRAATALRRAGALVGRPKREPRLREARARREVRAHVEAETAGRVSPLFLEALAQARLRDPRLFGALAGELHRRLVAPPRPFDPGCPVLVLCGEEDRTTPAGQAAQVARDLEGAHLELLAETGHYPQADALDLTVRAVRAFLAEALG